MPRIAQRLCSSLLLAASLSLLEQSHAQKHLGMKIAAGRYGNAWNSGHRESVNAQVTDDFAEELSRIPDSAWASAPRGGQGTIMGTSKSGSTGMVSVMTDQGPAQIAVTGRGFRWKVDDIYRAVDDGNIVSTKEQIRASRSTLDFMQGLRATSNRLFTAQLLLTLAKPCRTLPPTNSSSFARWCRSAFRNESPLSA